jgi:hypothetical protein
MSTTKIQHRKNRGATDIFKDFIDDREWLGGVYRDVIQESVVHTEAVSTALLVYHNDG